jgi:hypothetical protein
MTPGDSSTGYQPAQAGSQLQPCTFSVSYGGKLPAYVGLAVSSGGTGLYNGTSSGLQFQITDSQGTPYTTSGKINTNTSSPLSPLYVATDNGNDNTNYAFTVNYALPRSSPNSYRGLNSTLTLTVYAVQSGGNGSSVVCNPGSQCTGTPPPTWS